MTDSSIIKPFFFIKIKIVNKKNSKQWILFNYPKTREFGLVSCEGLMSLRDRILLILSLKVFESNHYTIILSIPLISPWLTMLFAQLL
jgi:hypothetical protein